MAIMNHEQSPYRLRQQARFRFFFFNLVASSCLLIISTAPCSAQRIGRDYEILDSEKIFESMEFVSVEYPDFIRVSTAQAAFGLANVGNSSDCSFDGASEGCLNYFGIIQDYVAHPDGSDGSNRLPTVLLSGALHGNERVGPTTVMETALLLLEAAACEALTPDNSWTEFRDGVSCRQEFRDRGISNVQRRWLARLVSTRRIIIVPAANSLGYFRNEREEGVIDPNRDFPYDQNSWECMQTLAGQTLNELFRSQIVQMALTYHAGITMIAYEWGAFPYLGVGSRQSPDHTAQDQIAGAFSLYGSGWSGEANYPYGPINQLLYAVHGGMEDWAYAGSWDSDHVGTCDPAWGYPAEKTIYNDAMLRAFNFLVETSDDKQPMSGLGTKESVLNKDSAENGQISRNIRLGLSSVDLVEPYLSIIGVDNFAFKEDIVPKTSRTCSNTHVVAVPAAADRITIHWTVGGSVEIEETTLWWSSDADSGVPASSWDDIPVCVRQPRFFDLDKFQKSIGTQFGSGFFSPTGSLPFSAAAVGPVFSSVVDVSALQDGQDRMFVLASAKVDSAWARQPANVTPQVHPQSHLVNARTNPDWYHMNAGKIVQGRSEWFSLPLILTRGTLASPVKVKLGPRTSSPTTVEPVLDEETAARSSASFVVGLSLVVRPVAIVIVSILVA